MLARVAIRIHALVVAILSAQDLPDGQLVTFADGIQQSRFDAVDGVEGQARRSMHATGAHAPQHAVDRSGVFAFQNFPEFPDHRSQSRSQKSLAITGDLVVGFDLHDGPVEVRLHDRRAKMRDSHKPLEYQTLGGRA
jgi:hypothetical protein